MKKLLIVLASIFLCVGLYGQCDAFVTDAEANCFGDCDGTLTVNANGTPPFAYLWDFNATTQTVTDLCPGTYSVTVTDADGCESTASGMVTEPQELVVTLLDSELSCFGACDGTLRPIVTGGTPPYSYLWNNGQSIEVASDLCARDFSVTVTDDNGCESSADATVTEPVELIATITASDDGCNSDEPVVLTASASGGAGFYTYQWSNNENTEVLSNPVPGTYSVTVTDANDCSDWEDFTVFEYADFTLEIESNAISCTDEGDLTLTAVAEGASSSYTYLWNNGEASQSITVQRDNVYRVFVTNENGCTREAEFDARILSFSLFGGDENCEEPGGLSAHAFPRGGIPPYTYTWSPAVPAPGESEQTNLAPGTYLVTVSDAMGCEATNSVVVAEAPEMTISFSNVERACGNSCNGNASAQITGGTPPYSIQWSDDNTAASSNSLCAGVYSVTVTDGIGCEVVGEVAIEEFPDLSFSSSITDVDCHGDCNGSIDLNVSGGSPPYSYSWSDLDVASQGARFDLCAGDYSVTVSDVNGCEDTETFTVEESTTLIANYSLENGCADGGATQDGLVVTGGSAPYEYLWDDGSTEVTIPRGSDPFAIHQVTITDANDCELVLNDVTGYETFQEEGQVLPLLSCEDGVMAQNAPPAGYIRNIINLEGDTVSGTDYLFTEVGNYTYLDLSATQTCLRMGSIVVVDNSLRDEISLYSQEIFNCDQYNCLGVSGLTDQQLISGEVLITFSGPDGNPVPADGNGLFCEVDSPGNYTVEVILGCDTVRRSIEISEPPACSSLSGFVFAEPNSNCTFDAEDIPVPETLVRIEAGDGTVFHAISGIDGYFEISVPSGTYTLLALPDGQLPANGCPGVTAITSLTTATVVDLFFPVPPCYELETWICMFGQRRCGFENFMSVYYSNPSGETVENVQLTLELDPFYTDISATLPVSSQFGNTLTFDIGTLAPYETDRFYVSFQISCEAEIGQTHCVRSLISPSGFCSEGDGPDEALVNITEASCDGDSIVFRVRNIGDQLMSVPLQYVVVEDGIMMRMDPFVEEALAPGEIFDIILPATGATYQVTTNQEPGAPVENNPSWAIEGCTTTLSTNFSTGLSNIQTIGNGVPWEDIVCRQNTGSNDPNDKYGYPLGYDGGQIEPGTRIDYDIRFQNNGTDTAFTVVIRDTLTEALDISTLKMEGGSHAYTTTLDTNRILTITFDNILLVDSLTNEPLSHGMVSFSIDHTQGLQPGDAIDNRVGIYFDFNEPVITNLSHHEIATEPLPNAVRYLIPNPVTLNVFPNPVTDELNIRALGQDVQPDQQVIITDLSGREVARTNYAAATSGWNVQKLTAGYYMLVLLDDNGLAIGRSGFVRL